MKINEKALEWCISVPLDPSKSMKYQWKGLRVVPIRTIYHAIRLAGVHIRTIVHWKSMKYKWKGLRVVHIRTIYDAIRLAGVHIRTIIHWKSMKYKWKGLRVVHIRTIVHGNRLTGMQICSKINENLWKSMHINEYLCKSMKNQWKSMKIYENLRKTNENQWKSQIFHPPSSIIHHPSSIIHPPSSIIHHPSSVTHSRHPLNLLSNWVMKQTVIKRNWIFYDRNSSVCMKDITNQIIINNILHDNL
jgi:hypothetical protein